MTSVVLLTRMINNWICSDKPKGQRSHAGGSARHRKRCVHFTRMKRSAAKKRIKAVPLMDSVGVFLSVRIARVFRLIETVFPNTWVREKYVRGRVFQADPACNNCREIIGEKLHRHVTMERQEKYVSDGRHIATHFMGPDMFHELGVCRADRQISCIHIRTRSTEGCIISLLTSLKWRQSHLELVAQVLLIASYLVGILMIEDWVLEAWTKQQCSNNICLAQISTNVQLHSWGCNTDVFGCMRADVTSTWCCVIWCHMTSITALWTYGDVELVQNWWGQRHFRHGMTKFCHPDHELDEAERLICVKIRILHVEIIHLKCKVEDSGRF